MTVEPPPEDRKRREAGAADTTARRYHSPRRQAQADATRAGIAAAARRLFVERGWAGTTVRGVAQAAGVSEPTLYATYGSKAGLAYALVVLRDAGRSNSELAAAYAGGRADADHLRHRVLAAWPPGVLRAGLDRDEAVDVYAALCNIDVYRELTVERRWSADRVERWLHETLCRLLLA